MIDRSDVNMIDRMDVQNIDRMDVQNIDSSGAYPLNTRNVIAVVNEAYKYFKYNAVLKNIVPVKPVNVEEGGAAIIINVSLNNQNKALKIWTINDTDIQKHAEIIYSQLQKLNSEYFVSCQFFRNALFWFGKYYSVSLMDWCDDAQPLKIYIEKSLQNPSALQNLAHELECMFHYLHRHNISHGDLHPGNIYVNKSGQLKLLDYDSLFFPEPYFENRTCKIIGTKAYQLPSVMNLKEMSWSSKKDYFAELILELTVLAFKNDPELWDEFGLINGELDDILFSGSEYKDLTKSDLYKRLITLPQPIPDLLEVLQHYLDVNDYRILEPFEHFLTAPIPKDDDLRYCTKCGKLVGKEDVYCVGCGDKLINQ